MSVRLGDNAYSSSNDDPNPEKGVEIKASHIGGIENDVSSSSAIIGTSSYANKQSERKGGKPSVFSKILEHLMNPFTPYLFFLYFQSLFNVLILVGIFYLLVIMFLGIKQDIESQQEINMLNAIQEVARCAREYERNKCSITDGKRRVPAVEVACTEWSKCMSKDPTKVAKAKLTARALSEIINNFIDPLSWKTIFSIALLSVGSSYITGTTFRKLYHKSLADSIPANQIAKAH